MFLSRKRQQFVRDATRQRNGVKCKRRRTLRGGQVNKEPTINRVLKENLFDIVYFLAAHWHDVFHGRYVRWFTSFILPPPFCKMDLGNESVLEKVLYKVIPEYETLCQDEVKQLFNSFFNELHFSLVGVSNNIEPRSERQPQASELLKPEQELEPIEGLDIHEKIDYDTENLFTRYLEWGMEEHTGVPERLLGFPEQHGSAPYDWPLSGQYNPYWPVTYHMLRYDATEYGKDEKFPDDDLFRRSVPADAAANTPRTAGWMCDEYRVHIKLTGTSSDSDVVLSSHRKQRETIKIDWKHLPYVSHLNMVLADNHFYHLPFTSLTYRYTPNNPLSTLIKFTDGHVHEMNEKFISKEHAELTGEALTRVVVEWNGPSDEFKREYERRNTYTDLTRDDIEDWRSVFLQDSDEEDEEEDESDDESEPERRLRLPTQ